MTESTDRTILPEIEGEEEMATIPCAVCGYEHEIRSQTWRKANVGSDIHVPTIRGFITCVGCFEKTVFEMSGNTAVYLPGRLFSEDLQPGIPKPIQSSFNEALLCFYGGANRGAVAMCRTALEEHLDFKGIKVPPNTKDDLYNKVIAAKDAGAFTDWEVSQAQGTRLIARDGLHRSQEVTNTEAQVAIGVTVQLLNHLSQWKPPASQ